MGEFNLYPNFDGYTVEIIGDIDARQKNTLRSIVKHLDIGDSPIATNIFSRIKTLRTKPVADLVLIDISDETDFYEEIFRFDSLSRHSHKIFMEHQHNQDHEVLCEDLRYPYLNYNTGITNVCRIIIAEAAGYKEHRSGSIAGSSVSSYEEFAYRLDNIADALAALRINSLSDSISEIRYVSSAMRERSKAELTTDPIEIQIVVRNLLQCLAKIFDIIDNSKIASLAVCGAVGYLVSSGGWPAIFSQALVLGAWQGKEAFLAVVNRMNINPVVDDVPPIEKKRRGPRKKVDA